LNNGIGPVEGEFLALVAYNDAFLTPSIHGLPDMC
jgi:hypothetical protein